MRQLHKIQLPQLDLIFVGPSHLKYSNPGRIQAFLLLQKVETAMRKGHFIVAKCRGISVEKQEVVDNCVPITKQ